MSTVPVSRSLVIPLPELLDLLSADFRIAIIGTVFTHIDASMHPIVRTAKNSFKGRACAIIGEMK